MKNMRRLFAVLLALVVGVVSADEIKVLDGEAMIDPLFPIVWVLGIIAILVMKVIVHLSKYNFTLISVVVIVIYTIALCIAIGFDGSVVGAVAGAVIILMSLPVVSAHYSRDKFPFISNTYLGMMTVLAGVVYYPLFS